jgi:beta-lactamase regulating signal transducer with metallopeptidase domain
MWGIVALRLVFPISIESVFSLIPSAETIPLDFTTTKTPMIQSGFDFLNSTVNPIVSVTISPTVGYQVNLVEFVTKIANVIWVLGIVGMFVYALVSYIKIKFKVKEATPLNDNIYICDKVETPFILGMINPKIYLPSSIDNSDIQYVIAHEKAHLKRKDHLIKPFAFALLSFYWFNPVLWIAFILFCKDIELACDEKVISNVESDFKAAYSNALVNCSSREKVLTACPLAFSETGVKERIKSVLGYKKPTLWIIIASVILCIVLTVCFLTNPLKTVDEKLSVFIDCEIASHHQSDKSAENFCALDWEVLGVEKYGNKTSVYMWVLYQEYNLQNGEVYVVSGSHIPMKITVEKIDGNYKLVEYFEPGDGTKFEKDIRENFPLRLQEDALNSQKYVKKQLNACDKMAKEYFEENFFTIAKTYRGEKIIYENGLFSSILFKNDNIPLFSVSNEMKIATSYYPTPSIHSSYREIGKLTEFTLTKNNFGNQFTHLFWEEGYSVKSILENNKRAWKTENENESLYLLLQNDGEVLITYNFRYIFKMQEIKVDLLEEMTYYYNSDVELLPPSLNLSFKDKTFTFVYSLLSSYIAHGVFELDDKTLTLTTYDGENVYVFDVVEDGFSFCAEKSSEIPKYRYSDDSTEAISPVPDDAVFKLNLYK